MRGETQTTWGDTQPNPRDCSEPEMPERDVVAVDNGCFWHPLSAGILEVREYTDGRREDGSTFWYPSYTRWTVWRLGWNEA